MGYMATLHAPFLSNFNYTVQILLQIDTNGNLQTCMPPFLSEDQKGVQDQPQGPHSDLLHNSNTDNHSNNPT